MSASEILRLAISLIVLVGGLLVVRRWGRTGGRPGRRIAGSTRVPIRVAGRAGITRHAHVAVIEVGQRRFLIGAGEQGVNLLAELATPFDGAGVPDTVDLSAITASPDAEIVDAIDPDLLTDPSTSSLPRMGLVARLQRSTLRTVDPSRPRADQP